MANLTCLIRAGQIDVIAIVIILLTAFIPFIFITFFIYDKFHSLNKASTYSLDQIWISPQYYLIITICVIMAGLIEVVSLIYKFNYQPTLWTYFQTLINQGIADKAENFKPSILSKFRAKETLKKNKIPVTNKQNGSKLKQLSEHQNVAQKLSKKNSGVLSKIKSFLTPIFKKSEPKDIYGKLDAQNGGVNIDEDQKYRLAMSEFNMGENQNNMLEGSPIDDSSMGLKNKSDISQFNSASKGTSPTFMFSENQDSLSSLRSGEGIHFVNDPQSLLNSGGKKKSNLTNNKYLEPGQKGFNDKSGEEMNKIPLNIINEEKLNDHESDDDK